MISPKNLKPGDLLKTFAVIFHAAGTHHVGHFNSFSFIEKGALILVLTNPVRVNKSYYPWEISVLHNGHIINIELADRDIAFEQLNE